MNQQPDTPPVKVSLSSPLTFFFKYLFPMIWGGAWSYGTALLFTGRSIGRFQGAPLKWVFLAMLIVGSYVCRRVGLPLKRVELEGKSLLISNYRKEISIPLSEVYGARFDIEASAGTRAMVVLEFKADTVFGRLIEFVPRSREAVELLRARLGPEIGGSRQNTSELGDELRGRGTV